MHSTSMISGASTNEVSQSVVDSIQGVIDADRDIQTRLLKERLDHMGIVFNQTLN